MRFSMGKGLRSSVKKANKARLRLKVFGPVEKARKERLSAKLLETARLRPSDAEGDTLVLDRLGGLFALPSFNSDMSKLIRGLDLENKKSHGLRSSSDADTVMDPDSGNTHPSPSNVPLPYTHDAIALINLRVSSLANLCDETKSVLTRGKEISRISKSRKPGCGKASAAMVFPMFKKGKSCGSHKRRRR